MAKTSLSPAEALDMFQKVADAVIAAEPLLSQADRDLGDGDHGLGMARGMTAVKEKLTADQPQTLEKVFSTVGMAMLSSMGGASGAIFGTVFRAGGKALAEKEALDSEGLSLFLNAAAEGVMKRGGAKPGDKTMIDALVPAAEVAAKQMDQPLPDAITLVAAAGEAGKEKSKEFIATMGRAKTLGENSIGFPDAGACSVALILATMRDYILA